MILSSEELEILEYLKSWNGKYVTMIEICRCAGGRKKFRENPNWAKGLMARLVESLLVRVNERGHYCWVDLANPDKPANSTSPAKSGQLFPLPPRPTIPSKTSAIVGDNYFPANNGEPIPEPPQWVSPQIAEILKKSGKKFSGSKHD